MCTNYDAHHYTELNDINIYCFTHTPTRIFFILKCFLGFALIQWKFEKCERAAVIFLGDGFIFTSQALITARFEALKLYKFWKNSIKTRVCS